MNDKPEDLHNTEGMKDASWGAIWRGWKEWLPALSFGILMMLAGLFGIVWFLYAVFTGTVNPEWFD